MAVCQLQTVDVLFTFRHLTWRVDQAQPWRPAKSLSTSQGLAMRASLPHR